MENLNQLTINEFRSLVKSWVIETLSEVQQTRNAITEKDNKFLNINEASALLGLVPVTIYSKVSKGELPAYKRGKRLYFSREALLKYIANQQKPLNQEKKEG